MIKLRNKNKCFINALSIAKKIVSNESESVENKP